MDQKNTIVKCTANPNCLFNHNGICDNYVITIGADGSCQEYVETATKNNALLEGNPSCCECNYFADTGLLQCPCDKHEQYVYRKGPACRDFKAKRGQRAKGNFYEDACDDKSTIKDVIPECDVPICDWSCKYALRSGPSFNPDLWCSKMKGKPAVGLFCSAYEEEK